jgi:hypothetical protein
MKMSTLYIVQAQPNPPGKNVVRGGHATDRQLNEEWIESEARNGDRNLTGDVISHLTFSPLCGVTGQDVLVNFSQGALRQGQRLRLHTGAGAGQWIGNTFYMYSGRKWFVWNNACGDRATVHYQQTVVDTAAYAPHPPEGVVVQRERRRLVCSDVPHGDRVDARLCASSAAGETLARVVNHVEEAALQHDLVHALLRVGAALEAVAGGGRHGRRHLGGR